jgi:hypothetical protein
MNMPADAAPEEPAADSAAADSAPAEQSAVTDSPESAAPPPSPAITPPTRILPAQSREDTDVGWGDYAERDDNDRLLRDRPPHWGNG